jgi:hypothetical protein
MVETTTIDATAVIALDPAVTIEDMPAPTSGPAKDTVARGWLVASEALETAAVLPPGRGLRDFVERLRSPTRLDDLVDADEIGTDALACRSP